MSASSPPLSSTSPAQPSRKISRTATDASPAHAARCAAGSRRFPSTRMAGAGCGGPTASEITKPRARRAGIVFWHIRPWIYVRETAPPSWSAPLHGGGGLLEYLCLVHLHRGDASNAGTDLGVCAAPAASLVLPQTNGLPGFCVPRCGQIVRYRVLTVYRTLGDPVPTCEEAAATARTRSRPFYALYIAHIALIAEGHGSA